MRVHSQMYSRCLRNESGAVAPAFGLMAIVLFLLVGAGIDTSRWLQAKQVTKTAMDAAVLAGGRRLQIDGDVNAAAEVAQDYYSENTKGRLPVLSDTVTFATDSTGTKVTASGNAFIKTTLLRLIGMEKMALLDTSGSDHSQSRIAVGGNAGVNLEISLMLDITGSMSGSKITSMQAAAKDLIDIAVWDNQATYTSKIALVPFSQAVNLGGTYFSSITGLSTGSTLADTTGAATGLAGYASVAGSRVNDVLRALAYIQPANADTTYGPCATDRLGATAMTDAAPGSGSYIQSYDVSRVSNVLTRYSDCKPGSITIQPLTNNKTALLAKVDSFVAGGWTAGSVGTAFAWYMISPKWADIWPEGSKPASYTDAGTKKIAVLMTDGEYNVWYNGSSNGTASEQAVGLCAGMKAAGIEVYTVGFDLDGNETATQTLAKCATDPSHAYVAEDGSQLKQAFRDIALKMSALYLSQ